METLESRQCGFEKRSQPDRPRVLTERSFEDGNGLLRDNVYFVRGAVPPCVASLQAIDRIVDLERDTAAAAVRMTARRRRRRSNRLAATRDDGRRTGCPGRCPGRDAIRGRRFRGETQRLSSVHVKLAASGRIRRVAIRRTHRIARAAGQFPFL
jgi:hypothetical protein